jgi:predicted acetyltransferase
LVGLHAFTRVVAEVELEIRPVREEELDRYVSVLELAAGRHATAETLAEARETSCLERTLAAFERGRLLGGLASDPLELTVPGGQALPAARITLTGVLPTHRRQGISSELNRRQLRWLRERGEPVAVFMTSGPRFYRRVGYSPATVAVEAEAATARHSLETSTGDGAIRVLDETEWSLVLPELFDRHRRLQPGQISRPEPFWAAWFLDHERYRKGEPGDRFVAVCDDDDGTAQGYATYRLRPGNPRDDPVDTLVIEDLVAVTGGARRSLWDYCLGFEQVARVIAHNLPADEPLAWMLADRRRLRVTRVRDFLWLRLVDLERALTARTYGASGSLVVEVGDTTLPDNAGRFRLETDGTSSSCSRTATEPDLSLDVADLAAVYLGGATFETLARAGRIRAAAQDALDRADALFASRPAPWTVSDW